MRRPAKALTSASDTPIGDLIFIGETAYKQKDYESAIDWLRLAMDLEDEAEPSVIARLLDHLSFSYHMIGNYKLAIRFVKIAKLMAPLNTRLQENADYFESQLEHFPSGIDITYFNEKPLVHEFDNPLDYPDNVMSYFIRMCRGEKMKKSKKQGLCTVADDSPVLKYKPQNIEHIIPGTFQDIKIFRNFLTENEVDLLIALSAKLMVKPSVKSLLSAGMNDERIRYANTSLLASLV